MALTDLPIDILVLIFPYLNASEFLAFTSISKPFLLYSQDPNFWQNLTRSTFRIPSQPLLQADGARWQWLYRNLLTQTKVYTWGNNQMGNLGHHVPQLAPNRAGHLQHQWTIENLHVGWPTEMEDVDQIGIVVDIQCGGWSTVLLNSYGQLFAVGMLNGQARQRTHFQPTYLSFPKPYLPTTKTTYEPSTAIREYSVGRSHILGLSDNGIIWHWNNIDYPAKFIKSVHVDTVRDGPVSGDGRVTRVTAGWSTSSAYVNGTGIIYWGLMRSTPTIYAEEQPDGVLLRTETIPGTSFNRRRDYFHSTPSLESRIGEVINHVVLDRHIVFFTHVNKVFAFQISSSDSNSQSTPVELTTFSEPDSEISGIQGSFRNFAVFTTTRSVLFGTTDHLETFCRLQLNPSSSAEMQLPNPRIIAALQKSSVISIAFGDHHFHALHANGTITSHGREPKGCGALGLGSNQVAPLLRGVYYGRGQQFAHDGRLEIPKWRNACRTVWFEPEKKEWLEDMWGKSKEGEALVRGDLIRQGPIEVTQIIAEWFEREGADWSRGPRDADHVNGEGGGGREEIGAYFALKVTAAGWHSGALVLVDEEKAAKVRKKYLVNARATKATTLDEQTEVKPAGLPWLLYNSIYYLGRSFLGLIDRDAATAAEEKYVWHDQPFPRLRLPNGEEMPGEIPLTRWKGEEPTFEVGEETETEL